MKNAKKIVSLVLALAMVLSMSIAAFAVDTNGKITIEHTVNGQTYSAYHLLNLVEYDNATGSYLYTVDNKWEGFFAEGAPGRDYVNVDSNGYVTWKDGISASSLVDALLAYLKDHTEITPTRTAKSTADDQTVTIDNVVLGYYLIQSTLGSICSLTTTKPEATVSEKNSQPTLAKEVKENSNGQWMKKNDADVGDTVEFKATITVQGAAKGYVMHDTMKAEEGLDYKQVSKVILTKAADATESTVEAANYTVNAPAADGDTFDVVFTDTFCSSLKNGDKITVYYEAELNENAIVNSPVLNEAYLAYKDSANADKTTEKDKTETFTWQLPVFKYTTTGETKTPLSGAKFSLFTDAECKNLVHFRSTESACHYVVENPEDGKPGGAITELEAKGTGEDVGMIYMDGLDSGTYYLKETKAPTGYNKSNEVIKVIVGTDGKITMDINNDKTIDATEIVAKVEVENKKGPEMPSTGGIGTTIFYILGSIMLLGAGVLLVTKKRMSAAK